MGDFFDGYRDVIKNTRQKLNAETRNELCEDCHSLLQQCEKQHTIPTTTWNSGLRWESALGKTAISLNES
jgi:hypothetical protein